MSAARRNRRPQMDARRRRQRRRQLGNNRRHGEVTERRCYELVYDAGRTAVVDGGQERAAERGPNVAYGDAYTSKRYKTEVLLHDTVIGLLKLSALGRDGGFQLYGRLHLIAAAHLLDL